MRRIVEHCLKLEHSPASEPRTGWYDTVIDARTTLEDRLTRSLQRDLRRRLPILYEQARRNVDEALRLFGEAAAAEALPPACPYALADLLRHGWYPASRHGLRP